MAAYLQVDTEKCKRDGLCAAVCPMGCIGKDAEGLPYEVADMPCIGCGHCVAVCPHGALANTQLAAEPLRPVPAERATPEALAGLVLGRRSVRAYKDTPVSREQMAQLLDLARMAPTAVNSQHVGWIVCCDPALTRATAAACMGWLRGSGIYPGLMERWDAGHEVVLRGAPAFVLAHAPAEYAWGGTDCAIALTTLELAAVAQGLGTCWAGLLTRAVNQDPALARAVQLPEGHVAHGGLMLGHPKYRYRLVPPRKPLQATWL